MSRSLVRLFLVLCIPLLVASCAATQLTSVWKDSSYREHPRKIMIIGVLPSQVNARIFEDEMVRKLAEGGTSAFASYAVLPAEPRPDRAAVEKVMREQGADAGRQDVTEALARNFAKHFNLELLSNAGSSRGHDDAPFLCRETYS